MGANCLGANSLCKREVFGVRGGICSEGSFAGASLELVGENFLGANTPCARELL